MILRAVALLLFLNGCTSIQFCKEENRCAKYISILKDIGYIEVVWTEKKVRIVATEIESADIIQSIAKGVVPFP